MGIYMFQYANVLALSFGGTCMVGAGAPVSMHCTRVAAPLDGSNIL